MKYNKEQIGNLVLQGTIFIVGAMWFLSFTVVLSSDVRNYFEADETTMWSFGMVFGFLFVPMLKHIISKIFGFCADKGIINLE